MSEERYKKPDASFARERRGEPDSEPSGIAHETFATDAPDDGTAFSERFANLVGAMSELCREYGEDIYAIELNATTIRRLAASLEPRNRYVSVPPAGGGYTAFVLHGVHLKPMTTARRKVVS